MADTKIQKTEDKKYVQKECPKGTFLSEQRKESKKCQNQ